jgi:pimeloyl-[acyl-carrier protein] methyl ester esterase
MKPLVFLHGWAQSRQIWYQQREAFPDALYLNLPGHGGADAVDNWVEALAQHLPETPCVLAGWSLGGQLALALAQRFPERIAALALISTTPRFRKSNKWNFGCDAQVFTGFESAVASASPRLLNRFFTLMLHGDDLSRSDYNALVKQAVDRNNTVSAAGLSAGLDLLATLDLRPAMNDISLPTLVMHGEQDAIVSVDSGRWLADSIPGSQFALFSACGHAPFLAQPERFNTTLFNWWSTL